jgi:hypothetical protein
MLNVISIFVILIYSFYRVDEGKMKQDGGVGCTRGFIAGNRLGRRRARTCLRETLVPWGRKAGL